MLNFDALKKKIHTHHGSKMMKYEPAMEFLVRIQGRGTGIDMIPQWYLVRTGTGNT